MSDRACLYDIGFCFCFSFDIDIPNKGIEDLKKIFTDKKTSAILVTDIWEVPFCISSVTCFIYHTYSRRAYDLYKELNGKNIRAIDPVSVQALLTGIGVRSASRPRVDLIQLTSGVII